MGGPKAGTRSERKGPVHSNLEFRGPGAEVPAPRAVPQVHIYIFSSFHLFSLFSLRFTDFIACATHLIREKYTVPDQLAIWGASAGGLLIGAVVNMRPDLFKYVRFPLF
jgi:hypothetical protein